MTSERAPGARGKHDSGEGGVREAGGHSNRSGVPGGPPLSAGLLGRVGATFATRVAAMTLRLVVVVATARVLGAEGRGAFALAGAITGVGVQVGTLGLHNAHMYFAAREPQRSGSLIGNALLIAAAWGVAGGVGLYGLVYAIPGLLNMAGALIAVAWLGVPVALFYLLAQNVLVGLERIGQYNKIDLLQQSISTAAIITLLAVGVRSVEVVYGMTIVAGAFGAFLVVITLAWNGIGAFSVDKGVARDSVGYGGKAYVAGLLGFLVMRVDLLIVNYLLGAEASGVYSIAVSIASMVYVLPSVVSRVIFPRLCRLGFVSEKLRLTGTAAVYTGLIIGPVLIGLGTQAAWLIPWVFGEVYVGAVWPLIWLLPGIFIWSVESILRKILTSDGYRMEVVYAWLVGFVSNVVLNLVLIPRFGLMGAGMASSAALALVAAITLWFLHREVRVA